METQARPKRVINEDKIKQVKKCLKSGESIQQAARTCGISYYTAWHISKGNYEKKAKLHDAFKKSGSEGMFDWKNFKIY